MWSVTMATVSLVYAVPQPRIAKLLNPVTMGTSWLGRNFGSVGKFGPDAEDQ